MAHMERRLGPLSTPDLEQLGAILERMIRAWEGGPLGSEERP
jgi:hypothetical protein